jgi:hypothetical protein
MTANSAQSMIGIWQITVDQLIISNPSVGIQIVDVSTFVSKIEGEIKKEAACLFYFNKATCREFHLLVKPRQLGI